MNTYLAIYNKKRIEVKAETQYAAQELAAKEFGLKKEHWKIAIMLLESRGNPVIHDTASL
jgi:hypothetical protein